MGLSGSKRLVNEFEIDSRVGEGHPRHHHEVEVITTSGRPIVLAIDDATRSARPGGGDGTGRSARLRRDGAGEGGHRRDRGRDQPAQARRRRRDRHPGPGIRDDRRGRGPGAGPRAGDGERRPLPWPTATRPPGRRAPGWGRSPAFRLVFDIYSSPGSGTASVARLWAAPTPAGRTLAGLEFGAVSVPLAGEEVCGDSWAVDDADGRTLVLVVGRAGARPAGRGGRPGGRPGLPRDGSAGPRPRSSGGPRRAPKHPRRRAGGRADRP